METWYKRYAEYSRKKGTNRLILDRDSNENYLERFYFIPRWITLGLFRIVIHRFWKGDEAVYHSHPWFWCSYILEGGYYEHRPDKKTGDDIRTWRGKGSFCMRKSTDIHYIELQPHVQEVWTLFLMGPKSKKSWGFKKSLNDVEIPHELYKGIKDK